MDVFFMVSPCVRPQVSAAGSRRSTCGKAARRYQPNPTATGVHPGLSKPGCGSKMAQSLSPEWCAMAGKDIDLDMLLDQLGSSIPKGHDIGSLGPSDSSDSGADMSGLGGLNSTSDRQGTGERASVEGDADVDAADIAPDDIVDAGDAGLGGGLDQAEEAQLGITDEEMEAALRDQPELVHH
jgi:hypothetical protein